MQKTEKCWCNREICLNKHFVDKELIDKKIEFCRLVCSNLNTYDDVSDHHIHYFLDLVIPMRQIRWNIYNNDRLELTNERYKFHRKTTLESLDKLYHFLLCNDYIGDAINHTSNKDLFKEFLTF